MTSSTIAASFTERAIGPSVSVVGRAGIIPKRLTSGSVGRRPTRLFTEAGPRIDPPVSSPMPTRPKFAAIPDPVPPDEPLAERDGAYAFRTMPKADPRYPDAYSPIVVFAMMTAPAFFNFVTMVASRAGTKSLNTADP